MMIQLYKKRSMASLSMQGYVWKGNNGKSDMAGVQEWQEVWQVLRFGLEVTYEEGVKSLREKNVSILYYSKSSYFGLSHIVWI